MTKLIAAASLILVTSCVGTPTPKLADAAETACEVLKEYTPFALSVDVIVANIESGDYRAAREEALKLYDEYKNVLGIESKELKELDALIHILRVL